jgi:2-C-methyl-D-erythritol 2,4-cyclodiphosphate synthase
MKIRVGMGFDVHQLSDERDLWLGGIKIPSELGLIGHSDADVLIHAIADAILGAAGLRDIGFHFPNTNKKIEGIDSKIILRKVVDLIHEKGWRIENIDATLVMEKPKINPYIEQMKEVLAPILSIEVNAIGIKATTNETMGFIGREEGATAYAVVLLMGAN